MFYAANSLGMTASQYMRQTTLREHLAYVQWLQDQWNEPSRSDHYLMQIAHILLHQKGRKVPFHKCKLKFTKDGKPHLPDLPSRKAGGKSTRLSPEEIEKRETLRRQHAANMAKSRWIGMLGGAKKIRILKPGEEHPK